MRWRRDWHAYLFIGPSLLGVLAFLLLPMVIVFVLMVIAYVSVLDFGFAKAVLAVFG